MFDKYISLCFIPNIHLKNMNNFNSIFNNCISLSYLPEINTDIPNYNYLGKNIINCLK